MDLRDRFRGCLLGLAIGRHHTGVSPPWKFRTDFRHDRRRAVFLVSRPLAANLGDDADTAVAVCGQVAGAYYGASAIPAHWLKRLVKREEIRTLADQLFSASANARS